MLCLRELRAQGWCSTSVNTVTQFFASEVQGLRAVATQEGADHMEADSSSLEAPSCCSKALALGEEAILEQGGSILRSM